jgi:hypothetical protein
MRRKRPYGTSNLPVDSHRVEPGVRIREYAGVAIDGICVCSESVAPFVLLTTQIKRTLGGSARYAVHAEEA